MKHKRWFSVAIPVILLLALIVIPASAQLGDTDTSTIYVQNVSGTDGVSVTVTFIAEDGTQIVPTALSGSLANPFTLDDGEDTLATILGGLDGSGMGGTLDNEGGSRHN